MRTCTSSFDFAALRGLVSDLVAIAFALVDFVNSQTPIQRHCVTSTGGADHPCDVGNTSLKTVPLSTTLLTIIFPLCPSTMPFTIHKPSPVPFSPLVLTNGSNIVLRISLGIPIPVSATTMLMCPDGPRGDFLSR